MSFKGKQSLSGLPELGEGWSDSQPAVRFSVSNPPPSASDFSMSKKLKGKSGAPPASGPPSLSQQAGGGKRKKQQQQQQQQKFQQLPPMDLETAEKKMDEWQRVAAGSRALRGLAAATAAGQATRAEFSPRLGLSSLDAVSVSSAMSGTEAEFLMRQINAADLSQLSLLTNPDEFDSASLGLMSQPAPHITNRTTSPALSNKPVLPLPGSATAVDNKTPSLIAATPNSVVTEALKGKIQGLDRQIVSLNAIIQKKESELEKRDNKVKSLQIEMEKLKKEQENEMKKLQSDHESDLLRIRDQHAKERASLLTAAPSAQVSSSNIYEDGNSNSPNKLKSASQFEGNKKLLDQLESLRTELRRSQESFAEERRSLQNDFNSRLMSQERKYKAEILEMKSLTTLLEDNIAAGKDEAAKLKADIQSMKTQAKHLDDAKKIAIDEQNRLRADLKNMQQSVAASFRLDTSVSVGASASLTSPSKAISTSSTNPLQRSSLPNDMEAALKLHDAKYEAKLRQMNNKVEFLKSQLESERKSCDEMKVALEDSQRVVNEIREDCERKLETIHFDNQKKLVENEERVRDSYEQRMVELTSLQRNFYSLQNQSQEMSQENMLLKQKEESLTTSLSKAQVHVMALKSETEQLKSQLQGFQSAKEEELKKDSAKLSQEAVLRRLDNERHYLKNQLTSEITLKNELQSVLTQAQSQLQEVQRQWQADVNVLKDRMTTMKRDFQEKEQKLISIQSQLDHDLKHNMAANQDLKDGFVKVRDQLRMEQLNVENLSQERTSLKEQVSSLTEEVGRLNDYERQNKRHFDMQIESLQSLLQEQEDTHTKEIKRIKEELQKQFMINSHGTIELMKVKDSMEREKVFVNKKIQVVKLIEILKRWRKKRVLHSFKKWLMTSTLMSVGKQFKDQVEKLLAKTKEDAAQEKERSLQVLRDDMTKTMNIRLAELESLKELEKQTLREKCDEEKRDALMKQKGEFDELMHQMEEDFEFDTQKRKKEFDEFVMKLRDDFDHARQQLVTYHQHELKRKQQEFERDKRQALEDQAADLNNQHLTATQALRSSLLEEMAKQKRDMEVEFDFKMFEKKREFEQEKENMRIDFLQQMESEKSKLRGMHEKALRDLEQQHRDYLASYDEQKETEKNNALRSQRQLLQEEEEVRLRELKQEWEEAFLERVEVERQKIQEFFLKEKEALLREKDNERIKAVKLEANKWRQVLQDNEDRLDLEMNKIKIEEKERLEKEFFEIERDRLNQEFALLLAKENERFQEEFAAQKRESQREMAALVKSQRDYWSNEMEHFSDRKTKELSEKHQRDMEVELLKREAAHNVAMSIEKERLDALRKDFTAKNTLYANERSSLMSDIAGLEAEKSRILAEKEIEIHALNQDFENEKNLLELKTAEEKKIIREQNEMEKAMLKKQMNEEFESKLAVTLQRERENNQREMEKVLQEMQEESEKLVNQLEVTLNDLRNEKVALSQNLDSLSKRLEDSEDALFDTQKAFKSTQKQLSIVTWQSATRSIVMQKRFQKGMEEFDQQARQRFDNLRLECQNRWNDLALHYLKVVNFVQDIESRRNVIMQFMTQHKSEDLKKMKKKVSILEQDIEKVTLERDAIEEQRDNLLQDIEQYTQEVRENEELVRQHQQESSMTVNGRINVAHARKKKRLDQEIERLLEQIEHKRGQIQDIELRVLEKNRHREEKENELIDVERELVGILIEQQRLALKDIQELGGFAEKTKLLTTMQRFPWPVPGPEVTIHHVERLVKQWELEDARK